MRARFTQSFKIQAVEKALTRAKGVTLKEVAQSLEVGHSTLGKWLIESRNNKFDTVSADDIKTMKSEKRPQDWKTKERLEMVIACSTLNGEPLSQYCREKGVYPHHVDQWKKDFAAGSDDGSKVKSVTEIKILNTENRALKKELRRKERALAEAAALLILQKKVSDIWGTNEEDA